MERSNWMGERLPETCSYSGSPPLAKGRRRRLHHDMDESEAGMRGWTRHTVYAAPSLVLTSLGLQHGRFQFGESAAETQAR